MEFVQTQVQFSEELINVIREHASRRGVAPSEFLQQAVSTEVYLAEQIENGAEVLVKRNPPRGVKGAPTITTVWFPYWDRLRKQSRAS